MTVTRIAQLASTIQASTIKINDYLASNGLPTPSFDPDSPPKFLSETSIAASRQAILEATDELHALMLGPIGMLTTPSHNLHLSLQAINRFDLARSFPNGKDEATFAEISSASGLDEVNTKRILRHAMTRHVFQEPREGVVMHTAASKLLASNPLLRHWVGMVTEEMWPSAARAVDAMVKWPASQEPNHSGFNIAYDTEETVFQKLTQHPERAERYAAAMSFFSNSPGFEPTHVVNNYPWDAGIEVVVDVGGSHGAVSIALAQRFPSLKCIVQDLPNVVAEGRAKLPNELTDRITFMAHDFFKEQPVKGADVYYFRWIMHDWSDKYAIQILQALVPALKPGAKVVIMEYVLPEPGSVSAYKERSLRGFDLAMLEFHNSRERDARDWAALFKATHPNLKFLGVKQPPLSNLGIIEASWVGRGE